MQGRWIRVLLAEKRRKIEPPRGRFVLRNLVLNLVLFSCDLFEAASHSPRWVSSLFWSFRPSICRQRETATLTRGPQENLVESSRISSYWRLVSKSKCKNSQSTEIELKINQYSYDQRTSEFFILALEAAATLNERTSLCKTMTALLSVFSVLNGEIGEMNDAPNEPLLPKNAFTIISRFEYGHELNVKWAICNIQIQNDLFTTKCYSEG